MSDLRFSDPDHTNSTSIATCCVLRPRSQQPYLHLPDLDLVPCYCFFLTYASKAKGQK